MNILVVEDDENKLRALQTLLSENGDSIRVARSYRSGLEELKLRWAQLVLLDMSLPHFDVTDTESGGEPHNLGGLDLLRAINLRGISALVVVVTQFDTFGPVAPTLADLRRLLRKEYASRFLGLVYYNAGVLGWQQELTSYIDLARRRTL